MENENITNASNLGSDVYTKNQMIIATWLAGPLAGCYMLGKNFENFSNNVFAGIKGTDKWTFKAITTGIEDNNSEQDVQVYPVPAKDVLNFKFGSFANHKVDFFDLDGRVVNSFATNNMLYTYSCSGMKKGMYICRILNDKETILKKIRIE